MKKTLRTILAPALLPFVLLCMLLSACSPTAIYKYEEGDVKASLKLYPTKRYAYVEYNRGVKTVAKGDYHISDTSINMAYPPVVNLPLITQPSALVKTPKLNNSTDHIINVVDLASGEPILFATVAFYGDKSRLITGSETDLHGITSISSLDRIEKIEVSYVGYITTRIDAQEIIGHDVSIGLREQRHHQTGCVNLYSPYILTATFDQGSLIIADKQFEPIKDNLKK